MRRYVTPLRDSLGPLSVLAVVVLVASLLGWGLANFAPSGADFSISARSDVLALEVACSQHLNWDLPPGRFKAINGEPREASRVFGVKLRGGARVLLRLGGEGHWQARFDSSPHLDCGAEAGEMIIISADGELQPPSPQGVFYESQLPMRKGLRPTLLLNGRVVLGEEIQAGIGLGSELLVTSILHHARIQVRTLDDPLGQRRLIHEEIIDAGGLVDSYGCLDVPDQTPQRFGEEVLANCVRKPGWSSQGFVYVGPGDDEPGFNVQLQVSGHHVGVRQQGGAERRVLVSWWSRFVSSSSVQIAAAIVFALGNLGLLTGWMEALRRRKE